VVMQFFCLDLGYQHVWGEIYLSTGLLDSIQAMGTCTSCPIYNRTYHKDFLPIFCCSVISFLEWLKATAKLPFMIDFKVSVSLLLMLSVYWKETIFDKALLSVTQSNVDALFLSMALSGILEIQKTNDNTKWMLGRQPRVQRESNVNVFFVDATIGKANHKLDKYWRGIHEHPPTKIRVRVPPLPATHH
jgi:hypothetical protein